MERICRAKELLKEAAEEQPSPFLLCVNRFIELLNFDKK